MARGFKQREGIEFGETFAPTFFSSCVRLLSDIACEFDLDLCNFHVDQTFVQSQLDEDIFLHLPKGCRSLYGKIVQLNRNLYRLKQTLRSWHVHPTLRWNTLGFVQYLPDTCVFRLIEEMRVAIILVVHVDDIFAVELRSRCDRFRDVLNHFVPAKS